MKNLSKKTISLFDLCVGILVFLFCFEHAYVISSNSDMYNILSNSEWIFYFVLIGLIIGTGKYNKMQLVILAFVGVSLCIVYIQSGYAAPLKMFIVIMAAKSFYKLLDKAFQVMCVTLLPLCVGLFLVANHAVIFLYGAEFQPTALTIRLLCPLILIKGFGDLYCYQMAYASKNEKIIVPASATASAINVATNAVLIPSLMQNGAVIASVASELITNMVQFVYMKKKVKFKLNMKPLVQSIITVAAMAVCVWKVGTLNFSNTVLLALEVIVGSVVYVVLNILMKNQLMLEVINMTKQRIHNATKKRI